MYKLFGIGIIVIGMLGCNSGDANKSFTLNGEIQNAADQKIFLEQVYFSQQAPNLLDTAMLVNGKFSLKANATEESLFRLRLQNETNGYLFINDGKEITFAADYQNKTIDGATVSGPANSSMKEFLQGMNERRTKFVEIGNRIKQLQLHADNDSALASEQTKMQVLNDQTYDYIKHRIDSSASPIVSIFALGYAQNMDTAVIHPIVNKLTDRFPKHNAVAATVAQYEEMLAAMRISQPSPDNPNAGAQKTGNQAPDFTMNDTEGKPFKLSSMKGKYVLVDFWASWCGPCRGENPNIVAAYHKFKDKNFEILGVSLDEKKDSWLNAIKADKLDWVHVSDLKGWANLTVDLYGYRAIPYNVLIDPTGKIIATDLRGEGLHTTLAAVLK